MRFSRLLVGVSTIALTAMAIGCGDDDGGNDNGGTPTGYTMQKLVANKASYDAVTVDENLVNPWGLAMNPTAFAWVANNGTGTSTLYDGNGEAQELVVTLPDEADATGIVFNGSSGDFEITQADKTSGAVFIFAGEGGLIMGWSPEVDGTHALTAYEDDNGASYKGLAIGKSGSDSFLYATDFANAKVDVFDTKFEKQMDFGFEDASPPLDGYAPFGIQAIGDQIYVSYAKVGEPENGEVEEETGAGLGYVNVFSTDGTFVKHFTSGGKLDAPWGMAKAPDDFGELSNDILIGNFGDGVINAYDSDGKFVGAIEGADGNAITLGKGLWGIAFGNDEVDQPHNTLFFASGVNDEADGVYGRFDVNGG